MNTLTIGDTFITRNNKFIATVQSIDNFVDQPNETTSYYIMSLKPTNSVCEDFLVAYSPTGKALLDEDFPDMEEYTSCYSDLDVKLY
jgi:hypothetical protein